MSEAIDLHAIVKKHAERLNDHEDRLDDAEERLDGHDRILSELRKNMVENGQVLARLEANGATKSDINEVLRDALNASPGWVMVLLTALVGITIVAGAASYWHHG